MHFPFDIPIPAGTLASAPYEKILRLTRGVIIEGQVIIPPGPQNLAHLVILYHDFQIYPLSRGENYHGDAVVYKLGGEQEILVSPYELKARAWNLDETYDHTLLVSFSMRRATEAELGTAGESLTNLKLLVGEEF